MLSLGGFSPLQSIPVLLDRNIRSARTLQLSEWRASQSMATALPTSCWRPLMKYGNISKCANGSSQRLSSEMILKGEQQEGREEIQTTSLALLCLQKSWGGRTRNESGRNGTGRDRMVSGWLAGGFPREVRTGPFCRRHVANQRHGQTPLTRSEARAHPRKQTPAGKRTETCHGSLGKN